MESEKEEPIIAFRDFSVEGVDRLGRRGVKLRSICLEIRAGEIVVLGGESGSGKSLLCEYTCGIRRNKYRVLAGEIIVDGTDVLAKRSSVDASEVTYIGKDSISGFNPHHSVEHSLKEFTRLLSKNSRGSERVDWNEAFYAVGIVEPERLLPLIVGELPSLMLLRLSLMRALLSDSKIIVCDEATSNLDRVAESQFIDLVSQIREEQNKTFVLGMGRLRNADRFADRILVLLEGGILESGKAAEMMASPTFRYTEEFLATSPRLTHNPHLLPLISHEALREAETKVHGEARLPPNKEEEGA